jgi:two-component system, OmpR family, sensor histidine kinase KdpD
MSVLDQFKRVDTRVPVWADASHVFDRHPERRKWIAYSASVCIPLLCSLAGWPLREAVKPAGMLLVYLLGVFLAAIRYGRGASILASFVSAASFAFFYAPPIFNFGISEPENFIGLAVMLVVAFVTSELTSQLESQRRDALLRERRTSTLYRLSKELATAHSEQEIVLIAARHIHDEFGARNVLILPDRDGRLIYPLMAPIAESLKGAALDVVRRVMSHGQASGGGAQLIPGGRTLYWPLIGSEGTLGVLVMEPVNLKSVCLPEQKRLLETFLNQITQSLERARSAEKANFVSIQMEAEALRNSLLNSISHDLRTPLATIIGASGSLDEQGDRLDVASRRKLIRAIYEEAQLMSDQTCKLLEMAKLESGKVVLDRQWVTLEEIIGNALHRCRELLQDRPVNVGLSDGLQLVYVDVSLIQQVMVNLLDNACKYTAPFSAIDIRVDTTPDTLAIFIDDYGHGIPSPMEQRIFEKFFRINAEGVQRGVGLGLSISRFIIEAHGGELRVQNRCQGGASFRITLPVSEQPPVFMTEDGGIS